MATNRSPAKSSNTRKPRSSTARGRKKNVKNTKTRAPRDNPVSQSMQREALGITLMGLGVLLLIWLMLALPAQSGVGQLRQTLSKAVGLGLWALPLPLLAIGGALFLKRLPARWVQRLFGYGVLVVGLWLLLALLVPVQTAGAGSAGLAVRRALGGIAWLAVPAGILLLTLGIDMLRDIVPMHTAKHAGRALRSGGARALQGFWQWRSRWKARANYGADKYQIQSQLKRLDHDVRTLGVVHNSPEEQAHLENWHQTIAQLRDRLQATKAGHSDAEEMLEQGQTTLRDWRDAVDGFTQESGQLLAQRMDDEGIEDFANGMQRLAESIGGEVAQLHPVGLALERVRQRLAQHLQRIQHDYDALQNAKTKAIAVLQQPNAQQLAQQYQQYQQRLERYEALNIRCTELSERANQLEAWRAYSHDLTTLETRHAGEPFDRLVKDHAQLLSREGVSRLSAAQARAEIDALLEQLNIPEPATARPFAHAAQQTRAVAVTPVATEYPEATEREVPPRSQTKTIAEIEQAEARASGYEPETVEGFEGVAEDGLAQAILEDMRGEASVQGQGGGFKPKLAVGSSIPKPSKPSFPSTDWQRAAEPVRFEDLNPEQPIDAIPGSYVASFQGAAVTPATDTDTDTTAAPPPPQAATVASEAPTGLASEPLTETDSISFATGPIIDAELALPQVTILQSKAMPAPALASDEAHVLERTRIINKTLQSFRLNGAVKKSVRGPTVSRFEIEPAEGEKISRYANLSDDIALAMGVESVRVEAPIQGKKNIIGLEVPNEKRDLVSFREAVEDDAFAKAKHKKLPVVLGRSIDGEMRIEDLGKMPHLLIAGSTGSGKSVAVNVLIASLLYRYTPEKLRFLMIDPKMVELTPYDAVPHLLRPVVTNPNDAAGVLLGAVAHMERRYKMMSKIGAKSLEQYNAKARDLDMPEMPYIVIIIDELADLMITSPKEVESAIMRLAQMARATGMHLILATQRPSVDILTSLIKVNIPARIAFAVSSSHDSRTILDSMGAERLTGQGDMLFYKPGLVKSIRLQGPFVSESEVAAIAEHWGNQTPFFEDEFVEAYGGDFDPLPDADSDVSLVDWNDDKLRDAAELVVSEGQASVSRLQRRLQVGHARAGKLMDSLEALAIVGPHQGSKPRDVLVVMADLPNILGRG